MYEKSKNDKILCDKRKIVYSLPPKNNIQNPGVKNNMGDKKIICWRGEGGYFRTLVHTVSESHERHT